MSPVGVVYSLLTFIVLQRALAFCPPTPKNRVALSSSRLFTKRAPIVAPNVAKDDRDRLVELYNIQVTRELEASQLYLAASIWFDGIEMVGMSKFMLSESDEERGHALSLIDFASKRGIDITLQEIEAPESSDWSTPEQVWTAVLDSEKENTQSLLNLADAAQTCHDYAVTTFLMPFHMEQVNSEDALNTIVAKVRDENKTPGLLRQLDTELGSEAG